MAFIRLGLALSLALLATAQGRAGENEHYLRIKNKSIAPFRVWIWCKTHRERAEFQLGRAHHQLAYLREGQEFSWPLHAGKYQVYVQDGDVSHDIGAFEVPNKEKPDVRYSILMASVSGGDEKWHYIVQEFPTTGRSTYSRTPPPKKKEPGILSQAKKAFDEDDFDEAVRLFSEVLKEEPNSANALYRRGISYRRLEQYEKAIADYTECLKHEHPLSRHSTHFARGLAYFHKGDMRNADKDFTAAIELRPKFPKYHRHRAKARLQMGYAERALSGLNEAIKLAGGDLGSSYPLTQRAECWTALGDFESARRDLDRAVLEHDGYRSRLARAEFLISQSDFPTALRDVNKLIDLEPEDPAPFLLRAIIRSHSEGIDHAETDLARAQELGTLPHEIELTRGEIFESLDESGQALDAYAASIQEQRSAAARRKRGWLLAETGEHEQAIATFQAVLNDASKDHESLSALAWIMATCPDAAVRDGTKALKYAERAHAISHSPLTLRALAASLAENKRFADALDVLSRATENNPFADREIRAAMLSRFEQNEPYRSNGNPTETELLTAAGPSSQASTELAPGTSSGDSVLSTEAAALLKQGKAANAEGDSERAIALLTKALKISPQSPETLLARAQAFVANEEFESALEDANSAIALDETQTECYLIRGDVLWDQFEIEKAIADYSTVLQRDPENLHAIKRRGQGFFDLEKYSEALVDMTKAIALGVDDPWYIYKNGYCYARTGDHRQAVDYFTAALKQRPKEHQWLLDRGDSLQAMGHYAHAVADYSDALKDKGKNGDGWALSQRAKSLSALGRNDLARKDHDRAVRESPGYSSIRNRAEFLLSIRDADAAMSDISEMIRMMPSLTVPYECRAKAMVLLGKLNEAEQDFRKASELGLSDHFLQHRRGDAYASANLHQQALTAFTEALSTQNDCAIAANKRGEMLLKLGRFEDASLTFRSNLRFNPRNAESHAGLAWILATAPGDELRNGEEAFKHAQAACERQPDARGLTSLAAANAELGDFETAKEVLQRSVRLDQQFERQTREKMMTSFLKGRAYRLQTMLPRDSD